VVLEPADCRLQVEVIADFRSISDFRLQIEANCRFQIADCRSKIIADFRSISDFRFQIADNYRFQIISDCKLQVVFTSVQESEI
jgi:hypothetical protein